MTELRMPRPKLVSPASIGAITPIVTVGRAAACAAGAPAKASALQIPTTSAIDRVNRRGFVGHCFIGAVSFRGLQSQVEGGGDRSAQRGGGRDGEGSRPGHRGILPSATDYPERCRERRARCVGCRGGEALHLHAERGTV